VVPAPSVTIPLPHTSGRLIATRPTTVPGARDFGPRRILARLVDEYCAVGLSYSTVRDHVSKRRPQILPEAGVQRN
jgi:hypothetical protein